MRHPDCLELGLSHILIIFSSCSMNQLVGGLDHLVEEIQAGDRASSVVSSNISDVSESISMRDDKSWQQLRRELEEIGLSPNILAEQHEFILKWLMNAVAAGRLKLEDQVSGDEVSADESAAPNSVAQSNSASETVHLRSAETDYPRPSWMRLLRFGVFGGKSNLHAAVRKRDIAKVKELLLFKIPIDSENEDGQTALEIAALNEDQEMVQFLLDRGTTTKKWGRHCLTHALEQAILNSKWTTVEALLEKGADFGTFELTRAVASGEVPVVQLMLRRVDVNTKLKNRSLVHDAAYYGNTAMFQLLLENGADIHAETKETLFPPSFCYHVTSGLTALHLACANCNTPLIQLILENGADIEATDNDGETALHKVPCASDGLGIHMFSRDGSRKAERISSFGPEAAAQLLLEKGADINAKNHNGKTALHLSAKYDEDLVMKLLLQNGIDLNSTDHSGNTALHIASSAGHPSKRSAGRAPGRPSAFLGSEKGMRLLLDHGANVNAKNFRCETPLHLASKSGNELRVKILVDNAANLDAVDQQRWTALHHAVSTGSIPTVLLLLRRGAATNVKAMVGSRPREEMTVRQQAKSQKSEVIVQLLESFLGQDRDEEMSCVS